MRLIARAVARRGHTVKGALITAAASIAAIAVAFGVSIARKAEPVEAGLSRAELSWVRAYGPWWSETWEHVSEATDATTGAQHTREFERIVDEVSECEAGYEIDVGKAPSRLEGIEAKTLEACNNSQLAAAALREGPSPKNVEAAGYLQEAGRLLLEANDDLSPHLLIERALPRLGGHETASRVEPKLSLAARTLTGHFVDVRCWSARDWKAIEEEIAALGGETQGQYFGVAAYYGDTVQLSARVCKSLVPFAYDGRIPLRGRASENLIEALLTLGHEAEHATGTYDEYEAECSALQGVRTLARSLGAAPRLADRIARLASRYYREGKVSVGYRTSACRNGGPLDIAPDARRWP
ncbi:MAG: hypothetical protein M3M94_00475 [Actinomycetota bacterium]|nr:hypothetical protein [Actinomycetota bacterium]